MHDHVQVEPLDVMLDFEIGARQAFLQIYGQNLIIRHCLFHLGQNINRRRKKLHLDAFYRNEEEYRSLVRSLTSLSFLNIDQVAPYFAILRQQAAQLNLPNMPNNALAIFDYFHKY